jgi:hypothetical protein
LLRKIVKHFNVRSKKSDQAIFLVRLPKEKPADQDKGENIQQLQEEIAKGETMFASIGGLRAQRGFSAWFFGRDDNFSFEIVSSKNKISFYITAPRIRALYLEQQIHAHYPEASIEEVEDYNIFNPQGIITAGYLKSQRSFIFPFLDYTEMDSDPMNSLINVMSKLESDESIAVQYVVRSAKKKWHRKVKEAVLRAHKNQDVSEILRISGSSFHNAVNFFVYDIILGMFDMGKPEKGPEAEKKQKELTEKEREMLKKMEEKNAKAGLDVNLRVVASTKSQDIF